MDGQEEIRKPKSNIRLILWVVGFVLIVGAVFTVIGSQVAEIDPFFHYHAPDTTRYFYELNNERSQNDGILRNFEYDALITGTSMAQNFKTSELDALFQVHSVKTTFTGGSFREIGDRLKRALSSNENLKLVVRSLDMDFFFLDYDDLGGMATGEYPTYLYDDNILNDYKYLLNRDILFDRVLPIKNDAETNAVQPGITSFDTYVNWMPSFIGQFGRTNVCEEPLENYAPSYSGLKDSEKLKIKRNVSYNILDIANAYPDVEFYFYITPYSAVWWNKNCEAGVIIRQIQAEQYIIEMLLECENIHLFSFNTFYALTTDLNNYKDAGHYGEWVNSGILICMKNDIGLLTKDNYLEYIREEYNYYANFNYTSLNNQIDYENDYDAAEKFLSYFYDVETEQ